MTTERQKLLDLYRTVIMEHAKKPRNFHRLEDATHFAEGINPLCGDKLRLYLTVNAEERVTAAAFEGSGCAISMASASLLTETITNASIGDAHRWVAAITDRLTLPAADKALPLRPELAALEALDGVREHPSRIKCATLAWQALHAALTHSTASTTTE